MSLTSATSTSSSIPIWVRTIVTNKRLVVKIFYGTCHFGMWQSEVRDILFQQGLDIANIAIEEKKLSYVEDND